MHPSIQMNQAHKRQWSRAATLGLAVIASFLSPALCQAQTPPVYTISTVVGMGPPATAGYGGDGFAAISANLNGPASLAFDSKGNMYICDQVNNVIRMVAAGSGNISTVAGNNTAGYTGDAAAAVSAQINIPDSIVFDSKGNYYFSDFSNGVVRMVNTSGIISTFAGSQAQGRAFSGDGGAATASAMFSPSGIAFDAAGNMYISDYGSSSGGSVIGNNRIREVFAATGNINTVVGNGSAGYFNGNNNDGVALQAQLNGVGQIALDAHGNLYLADSANNAIRKVVLATGTISTFAGSPTAVAGYSGDGALATGALLDNPTGVAVDSVGNVYICDTFNDVIRVVTPDGNIHTIAGGGVETPYGLGPNPGYTGDGGPALSAQFDEPYSITVDSAGNLYIADYGNNVIRKLVPNSGLGTPPPVPAIRTSQGVIGASDFGALASVAPGSWIEIYGTNLAPITSLWTSDFTGIEAPTSLNNTTVSVAGQSAFVEYISPTQVNAQVPGGVGLGTQSVIVSTAAGASAAYNINVNLEEPALYAPTVFKILGVQYVGALFNDLATYVFPPDSFAGLTSRAAKPGDTIVLYGVGFGAVPGNPPGQIPQAANGLNLPIIPKFYFNGVQAQVSYAGLAPGFIGEYQFNVIVPSLTVPVGIPTAVALTFIVSENGTPVSGTQTLFISVEN